METGRGAARGTSPNPSPNPSPRPSPSPNPNPNPNPDLNPNPNQGPAMVKGAGLGSVDARAIGPAHEQHAAGVVDVLVGSDAVTSPYTPLHPLTSSYIPLHPLQVGSDTEAAEAARQVLSYSWARYPHTSSPTSYPHVSLGARLFPGPAAAAARRP